jgi:hypothetical protein
MRLLNRRLHHVVCVCVCAALLLASGCAHQPEPSALAPPGFWLGLVHGFLIVFSFFGSLFTDVRIYAFPNGGVWYDFGYVLGASMFLGGGRSASNS